RSPWRLPRRWREGPRCRLPPARPRRGPSAPRWPGWRNGGRATARPGFQALRSSGTSSRASPPVYLRLQTPYAYLVADASTFEPRSRRRAPPPDRRGPPRSARVRRVARPPPRACLAHARALDGPGDDDAPAARRLRRARSAGRCRRRAPDYRPGDANLQLAIGNDAPG